MANEISAEQLQRLRRALDLIADVQVEMSLADPMERHQWTRLYQIRCELGQEFCRLKLLAREPSSGGSNGAT